MSKSINQPERIKITLPFLSYLKENNLWFNETFGARTSMGKGVDFMEGTHEWHGIAPNDAQLESALQQLEETIGDY